MRLRTQTIEKQQLKRVKNVKNQAKYLEDMLTAELPKYNVQSSGQRAFDILINAKKLYFNSPQKKQNSPVKLKSTFMNQKSKTKSCLIEQKGRQQKGCLNKTFSVKKYPKRLKTKQNQIQALKQSQNNHPYSIIRHLQKLDQDKPQKEKKYYKYRPTKGIKSLTIQQIDEFIDDLVSRSYNVTQDQRFSVTDQFILSKYLDVKIQNVLAYQNEGKMCSKGKQPMYDYGSANRRKQADHQNQEILSSYGQIQSIWSLYEIKLQFCHDIMNGNPKDQLVYQQINKLYRQLLKLQDQIYAKQKSPLKFGLCLEDNKVKMNRQILLKKVQAVIKKFKQIITKK